MFVILVYDINQKRVTKVLKKCRQYLHWVQNSVFEGEITKANYKLLTAQLKHIINPEEDSVIIYTFRTKKYTSREIIGLEKGGKENIL